MVDPEQLAMCEGFDLREHLGMDLTDVMTEVSYTWNPETDEAKEIGTNLNRDYTLSPEGWIAGTADIVQDLEDIVYVDEIKTGKTFVPRVEDNWQVKFLVLAAARAYHKKIGVGQIIKVGDDGRVISKAAYRFDENDLNGIAKDLREILDAKGFCVGDHCKWCPAFTNCPIQARTALALINSKSKSLTKRNFATALHRTLAVKSALPKALGALQQFVEVQGPQDLGDGTEAVVECSTRETIDPSEAIYIVQKHLGIEALDVACSLTKSSLKRAVEFTFQDPDMRKSVYVNLMEALELRGGLTKQPTKATLKVKKRNG
jgi:hypothetical protein